MIRHRLTRYALESRDDPEPEPPRVAMTQEEVAQALGMERSHVGQIERRALAKIRAALQQEFDDG